MTTLEQLEARVKRLERLLRSRAQTVKPSLADHIKATAQKWGKPFQLQTMVAHLECSGVLAEYSPISITTAVHMQLSRATTRGTYRRIKRGWYELA